MPKSIELLTYDRATELINEYKHCPFCKKSDDLVAVRYGDYPPGKSGAYWKADTSDEIVCLNCNIVWNLERLFVEHFKEVKND